MLAGGALVVAAVQYSAGTSGPSITVQSVAPPQPSPIAVRLADALGRASLGGRYRVLDMRTIAPLAWDRVYVFTGETKAGIRRRLGFDWSGAPARVPRPGRSESLLVFVRGHSVTASVFFSDGVARLTCLTAPSGYPRRTRFRVGFTHGGPSLRYLASAQPDAREAACERALGKPAGR